MPSANTVILIGNCTRDPELRHTQGGTAICKFGLAINRQFSKEGEKKQEVTFVDCVAWGRTGEVIAQYCKKGHAIYVQGRLSFSQWEDKEGGKRSKLEVTVEGMQLLQGRDAGGGDDPGEDRPARSAQRPVRMPPKDADLAPDNECPF